MDGLSRKSVPEQVGPSVQEQQPEYGRGHTQTKKQGPLGWRQLDTPSN